MPLIFRRISLRFTKLSLSVSLLIFFFRVTFREDTKRQVKIEKIIRNAFFTLRSYKQFETK